MELRALFTPTIGTERIKDIENRILHIEEEMDQDKDVNDLIPEFNTMTGKTYDKHYFQTYWKFQGRDEFAHAAALPVAVKVNDITKEELIELVDRIKAADMFTSFLSGGTEYQRTSPRVSDLIFWPQKEGLTSLPSSEEIINTALSYKPILL